MGMRQNRKKTKTSWCDLWFPIKGKQAAKGRHPKKQTREVRSETSDFHARTLAQILPENVTDHDDGLLDHVVDLASGHWKALVNMMPELLQFGLTLVHVCKTKMNRVPHIPLFGGLSTTCLA